MYVKFEFTQEDLVDASKRFLSRQTVNHSRGWKNPLLSALAIGVMVFLFIRNQPVIGLLISLVVGGIIFLLYPQLERSGVEGRLRRMAEEMMPPPGLTLARLRLDQTVCGCVR